MLEISINFPNYPLDNLWWPNYPLDNLWSNRSNINDISGHCPQTSPWNMLSNRATTKKAKHWATKCKLDLIKRDVWTSRMCERKGRIQISINLGLQIKIMLKLAISAISKIPKSTYLDSWVVFETFFEVFVRQRKSFIYGQNMWTH